MRREDARRGIEFGTNLHVGKHIVGNWKMHGSAAMVESLLHALIRGMPEAAFKQGGKVTVCPPFPFLPLAAKLLADSRIGLGAQNCYPAASGAFTGEVSPLMLRDCGATWCLVGHSERRNVFGESDAFARQKLEALVGEGIRPILCVGEKLPERQAGTHEAVVDKQLDVALNDLPLPSAKEVTIAYEPVWAIGTGHTATPEQVQAMHAHIRRGLIARLGEPHASSIPILYGGSVNPGNAHEILHARDIDGVLVGGASLKADQFLGIVEAGAA